MADSFSLNRAVSGCRYIRSIYMLATVIELGLLGLLSEQDLHGYELKKQLSELLGSWSTLSFGSLYPALARLERADLVRAVDTATTEPPVPMTGALSGELAAFRNRLVPKAAKSRAPGRRGKKVYGITGGGRERLAELLRDPGPDDERTFALRVAFCRHLPVDERLALFERRKAELNSLLAARRRAPGRRSDPYLRSLRERDTRALAHDLSWVDELIEATRSGGSSAFERTTPPRLGAAVVPSPSLTSLTTTVGVPADAAKEGSP
jgi:DNA-binding PadR family transcriptional regulator